MLRRSTVLVGLVPLLCFASVFAVEGHARAEASALVLVTTSESAPPSAQVTTALRRALAHVPSVQVLDASELDARLATEGELPQASASANLPARSREADELLQAVAFGYDDETIARGQVLLDEHRQKLGTAVVSDEAASALGNVCLYVVRALEHRGDAQRGGELARECLRLVPDLAASAELHPPSVRARLGHAKLEAQRSTLRIELAHAPDDCRVLVQGRPRGRATQLELVPGEYLVQLECERPGLVRRVRVREGEVTTLPIAANLEMAAAAVRAGEFWQPAPGRSQEAVLGVLARKLSLRTLWIAHTKAETLELARFEDARIVAHTSLVIAPASTLESRATSAMTLLACSPNCRQERDDAGPGALGIATVSLGGAAVLASWVLWAQEASVENELDALPYDASTYEEKLSSRDALSTAAIISSTAGAAFLTTAAFAWLPRSDETPLWAWLSGGAGVVAMGAGLGLWLDDGEPVTTTCPSGERCLRRRSRVPLAPMLVAQGLALTSIPLAYVLRGVDSEHPDAQLSLQASPSAVRISYGGQL